MRRSHLHAVVSIVLVSFLVAAPAAGASTAPIAPGLDAGRGVAASGDSPGSASLGDGVIGVRQGEATTMEVRLRNTDRATVIVGGDESGYNITITVTDGDGDGSVPLEFRTDAVGMDATRFRPVDDADDYATLDAAPNPDGAMPLGDYPIAVYAGHGPVGSPADVGTLTVTEPTPAPTASIDRAGDGITLHPATEQPVSGIADLEAGRTLTVRLRSSGGSPFLKTDETAVGSDGTFTARFDLSGVDAPAKATAAVYVDGERVAGPTEVSIVAAPTTSSGTETPGQPGLGVVVAMLALLVAAGLAHLRRP